MVPAMFGRIYHLALSLSSDGYTPREIQHLFPPEKFSAHPPKELSSELVPQLTIPLITFS